MNSPERDLDLGGRLRALRRRAGLSQRRLAQLASVSNATISMIEAEKVSPSVSALRQILAALGVSIGDFFAAPEPAGEQVVFRAEELTEIAGGAVSYRQVGANLEGRSLQMIHERYRPGAQSGVKMISHQGEEAGLVIKGRLDARGRRRSLRIARGRRLLLRQPQAARIPQRRRRRPRHRLRLHAADVLTRRRPISGQPVRPWSNGRATLRLYQRRLANSSDRAAPDRRRRRSRRWV